MTVRGITDDMTIGRRVAFYRRRRGLSQEVLAGLVGKTGEWLRKVETGRAELDRLSVIRSVAGALNVPLADLIGETGPDRWPAESGREAVPALRLVLHDCRHLAPTVTTSRAVDPPAMKDLERDVADLWSAYQQSRYGLLAGKLPQLIQDCVTAGSAYEGDLRVQALSAYGHQVAALFLTKLGEVDLSWIAASRGLSAANSSDDPVVIGSLSRAATHALAAIGEFGQAEELASATCGFLRPRLRDAEPRLLSVYGGLQLMGALAAARDSDRAAADAHLTEAEATASRLGADANHVWTAFGPTNVAIHRAAVALALGDVQRAIDLGIRVDTRGLPVERRVRHSMETARALLRRNRTNDALGWLLEAEQIGPDQVRYHRLSRAAMHDILNGRRPARPAIELAGRMGIPPNW